MAPETTTGEGFDRRADLFSAAIVLWETLTSRRLFKGANDLEVLRQLSLAPIPHLRDIDPTLPRSLDAVVSKGLQRDPAARYATAAEFADALESAGEAIGIANPRAVAAFVKATSAERIDELAATVRDWTEGEGKRRLVVIEGTAARETDADAEDTSIRDTAPNRSAPALTNTPAEPSLQPQPRSSRRAIALAMIAAGFVVLGALIALVTLNVIGTAPQTAAATTATTAAPHTTAVVAPMAVQPVDAPVTDISDLPRSTTVTRPVVGHTPHIAPIPSAPPSTPSATVAPTATIVTAPPSATTPAPLPSATNKPAPSSTSFNPEAM